YTGRSGWHRRQYNSKARPCTGFESAPPAEYATRWLRKTTSARQSATNADRSCHPKRKTATPGIGEMSNSPSPDIYCKSCHRTHAADKVHGPYRRHADIMEDYHWLKRGNCNA